MREGLRDGEAVVEGAEDRGGGYADVGEGDGGVVGRHVESPLVGFDLEAGGFAGNEEGGDANGGSRLCRRCVRR